MNSYSTLSVEDIVSSGFALLDDRRDIGQATFEKSEWFVVWTKDVMEIHYKEDMVFCGKLQNKREFEKVLKQVNIYENSSSTKL